MKRFKKQRLPKTDSAISRAYPVLKHTPRDPNHSQKGFHRGLSPTKIHLTTERKRNMNAEKCVILLDETLPNGLLANTAAILGITLGKTLPETVGRDIFDRSDHIHRGIIEFPVPILRGTAECLKTLRERLYEPDFADVVAVDFSDLAQGCKTYEEFTNKMESAQTSDLRYLGLAICGTKKQVNRLTGSLPLLR